MVLVRSLLLWLVLIFLHVFPLPGDEVDVPVEAVVLVVVPVLLSCRSSEEVGLAALGLLPVPRNILDLSRPRTAGTDRNRWRRSEDGDDDDGGGGDLDLNRM